MKKITILAFLLCSVAILFNACGIGQKSQDSQDSRIDSNAVLKAQNAKHTKKYRPASRDELIQLIKDESIYLGDIDTSKITDMSFLFYRFNGDDIYQNLCNEDIPTHFIKVDFKDNYKFTPEEREKCKNSAQNRVDFSGIGSWDTSSVKDMQGMFFGVDTFNEPIESWNVANVENMRFMFFGAKSFNQPLNAWNVAKVKNMRGVFWGANAFNQPLNLWDTSRVEDMSLMFSNALDFNQPLDSWNVANVREMARMFELAVAFNQPLNKWNVSKARTMNCMFLGAKSFNQPLDKWNVNNLRLMEGMFAGAKAFNQNLDSWNIKGVAFKIDMIDKLSELSGDELRAFQKSLLNMLNMDYMFDESPLENNPPKWYKEILKESKK